ncbi:MAG: molybdopterin converting factor subunit 1 [Rhodospirillales bacterium]|jgi:molybdopterin synthase sulfur carrier subunit|nr:molybdopterin converting factor subunit 1 [Rhodospirillales bacterium]
MKILYFAWVRERIGVACEEVSPPAAVDDAAALVAWLRGRSEGHAEALADLGRIRVAVNQEAVGLDHPVAFSDEVAFFPPMTGG